MEVKSFSPKVYKSIGKPIITSFLIKERSKTKLSVLAVKRIDKKI